MKMNERRAAVLAVTENIEMELFSSEESCVVIPAQDVEEQRSVHQRRLEHPLVPVCEEEPEPQVCVQPQQHQAAAAKTVTPTPTLTLTPAQRPAVEEKIEIEMEVFPPIKVCASELKEIQSDHSSIMTSTASPSKARQLKWKRLTPQKMRLVVKDVVCLPRDHGLEQADRLLVPRGKERAALSAVGLMARITVDYGWSAGQLHSRLTVLFRGRFMKRPGQRLTFTYLQCVPGSRVLFVPEAPAEGWTGEQVLRISGQGVLYVLGHLDNSLVTPADSDRTAREVPVVDRKDFCLEVSTESCQEDDAQQVQQQTHRTTEESTSDLVTILRQFRQQNLDQHLETHHQVRRRDLLHSALKVLRRPGFCFRTPPIICFSGEEANGHEGPMREFFRLALLELQQSSVFEGPTRRLFFTYDLKALEDGKYRQAGVLIGWSLAQGGPGPRCLHPTLYQLMCGHNASLDDFNWRDIVDNDVQLRLQQLQSCADVKELSPSLCHWVSSCGIPAVHSALPDEIPAIYARLVKHHVYHRVASMITQFTEGLNSCGGLWDVIRDHWEAFVPVMTQARQQPLTLDDFRLLFTVCYSTADSQLRAAEEETVAQWERVLVLIADLEADFSFEDLLVFITGADHLPPLGLPGLISLCFYSQDASLSSVRLPHASTCALELFLPRGGDVDLLVLLRRAVHGALGFTCLRTEREDDGRRTSGPC